MVDSQQKKERFCLFTLTGQSLKRSHNCCYVLSQTCFLLLRNCVLHAYTLRLFKSLQYYESYRWSGGVVPLLPSTLWDHLMINYFSISCASVVPRVWQALLVQNFHVCSMLYNCFSLPQTIESNWRCGRHSLQRIHCRSETSKGVYCLQYDDQKIVSGLRDNTIKVRAPQ